MLVQAIANEDRSTLRIYINQLLFLKLIDFKKIQLYSHYNTRGFYIELLIPGNTSINILSETKENWMAILKVLNEHL
jgi:hypothetical protein